MPHLPALPQPKTNYRAGTIATRVRKNAKDLTQDEWARFINALKGIKNRSRPGGVLSIYDEFSALHMGAVEIHRAWRREHPNVDRNDVGNSDPAHDNPSFLPWHRQFLLEFERALQSVDPSVTLPYWDWTDREFNKKLFSSAYMGGNGGFDGRGGALVTGPFTLDKGWVVNTAIHRNAWFSRGPNGTTLKDPVTGDWKVQPSLGRSVVRYLGDFEDLATPADVIEFTKRKHMFGPEKLVFRSDLIPVNPDDADPEDEPPLSKSPLPRGTIHIGGGTLPLSAFPKDSWIKNRTKLLVQSEAANDDPRKNIGDSDRSFREDVQGFRWALEASPHMHNQTHDWFGYHTTILQDDEISGASSMPNVACSTADPMFFLHHCNIDRLWAEWQDSGHYGSIFYPKRGDPLHVYDDVEGEPIGPYTYPYGHNLDDLIWPWDNNRMETQQELQEMLPQFPYTLTPRDMLDYRGLGYTYDTSTQLAVNSVTPVRVYLPAIAGKVTRQVFQLAIQRKALYLIAAWNKGFDKADLEIAVYEEYQEKYEGRFITGGFQGKPVPPMIVIGGGEPVPDSVSSNQVYELSRHTYYVVVTAVVPEPPTTLPDGPLPNSPIDAVYEIGIATNPTDFKIPDIPIASGVISNPQVPAESAVYLAKHRYAPVNLEDGVAHTRLTRIKGAHELFGIIVPTSGWFADITFEGMDALVQLYGPFDEDNDSLPHFDDNGLPVPGDNATRLSAQLQIASSEGCCERRGSGISSLVTPGRYVLLVFHCSIGINEERPYQVTYNLYHGTPIPPLRLQETVAYHPRGWGRSVNLSYRVTVDNSDTPLVTRQGEIYRLIVRTDDARTQEQVRVAVFTYHEEALPPWYGVELPKKKEEDKSNISYNFAYWGKSEVTFEPEQRQKLFVRVTILNGYRRTSIKTSLVRIQG